MSLLYALHETGSKINADSSFQPGLHGKKEGAGHAADWGAEAQAQKMSTEKEIKHHLCFIQGANRWEGFLWVSHRDSIPDLVNEE